MARSNSDSFCWKSTFEELTGHSPLPWQERLYEQLVAGEIPGRVDIPTGLGKTMVIVLWLLAFIEQRRSKVQGKPLPRRLCYVVNRRTIVDQSTSVVEELVEKIAEAARKEGHPLRSVYDMLSQMAVASDGEPLAVSTLRGELADNRLWLEDPIRPAIVVGTIDMIGSKLLFSGYGDSRRVRPLHTGLLGCDTLFVHDEAHLTPAFGKILQQVRDAQRIDGDATLASLPKMEVMELSATLRGGERNIAPAFTLSEEDRKNAIVQKRIHASKQLFLRPIEKVGKVLQDEVIQRAITYDSENGAPQRIIVFVQSPADASKIVAGLLRSLGKGSENRIALLTGQIRGHERDELLKTDAMKPFLSENSSTELEKTVYLVSTSAGEVGMDLHADHAICDLTTLDSMIQRLGRVNRFGGSEAQVEVFYEKTLDGKEVNDERKAAEQATLKFFQQRINGDGFMDASPAALVSLNEHDNAFSPEPDMVELTDILQDFWSQTSINDMPGRPEVAPWLHGVLEELPETWIAWREEAAILLESPVIEEKDLQQWFQRFPLSSKETLRKPTHELFKQLQKSGEKGWIEELCSKNHDQTVILISATGEVKRKKWRELLKQQRSLNFATLIFPTEWGRLGNSGAFDDGVAGQSQDAANLDNVFERVVLRRDGNRFSWHSMDKPEKPNEGDWKSLSQAIHDIAKGTQKRLQLKILTEEAEEWQDEDEATQAWLLLLRAYDDATIKNNGESPSVTQHNDDVAKLAKTIAEAVGLPETIIEAFRLAGQYHDVGKMDSRWQMAAGYKADGESGVPRAKPKNGSVDWRKLAGYRHELDSLMKAEHIEAVANHPERDLILHLIATHHGWARPHFQPEAFAVDVDHVRVLQELMHRYVALQERFGHWRLAWLESLLRRADGIASAQYTNDMEEAS